ncbi:MAG TPA: MerC domain-containing protein [Parafilimonas sp.]|nr:MerC domain-containing protein [Parafilimonas sp.]
MDKVHKPLLDKIGIGASLACAIHCIALPLIFSTLPLFGIEIIENWKIEVAMIGTAFITGSWALYHGYKKHHHHFWLLPVFAVGLSLVVTGNLVAHQWLDMTLKFFGAGLIVTAHIFNLKYNKQCTVHSSAKNPQIKKMYPDLKQTS